MLNFAAALGWNLKNHTFRGAKNYTKDLAILVYNIRLLIFHAVELFSMLIKESLIELLQNLRRNWLLDNGNTPFAELASLLAYGRKNQEDSSVRNVL